MSVVAVAPVVAVGGLVAAEVAPEPGQPPVAVVAATLGSGAAG